MEKIVRETTIKFHEEMESLVIPGTGDKFYAYRITTTSEEIGKSSSAKRFLQNHASEGLNTANGIKKF